MTSNDFFPEDKKSNDPSSTENYESDLIQHFKEVIKEFNITSSISNNVTTDYTIMFQFLLKKHRIYWGSGPSNVLYYALTHRTVPALEKKGLLKRYKIPRGRYLFVINKEKVLNGLKL